MSVLPRMRPRFRVDDPRDADEVLAAVLAGAAEADGVRVLRTIGHHVELGVPEDDQRFWSPCLSVEIEAVPEPADPGPVAAGRPGAFGGVGAEAFPGGTPGQTIVRGLIGPRPDVWTMFAALHGFFAFVAATALMVGAAQVTLGESAAILWAAPAAVAMMGLLYAGSQFGQRLAHDQVDRLRGFLHDVLPGEQKDRPASSEDGAPARR